MIPSPETIAAAERFASYEEDDVQELDLAGATGQVTFGLQEFKAAQEIVRAWLSEHQREVLGS